MITLIINSLLEKKTAHPILSILLFHQSMLIHELIQELYLIRTRTVETPLSQHKYCFQEQ
jgi:hypothetical protein